jgi:hypothetical protein
LVGGQGGGGGGREGGGWGGGWGAEESNEITILNFRGSALVPLDKW